MKFHGRLGSRVYLAYPTSHVGVLQHTVKAFNLAALKVGDFACKIILAAFILTNKNHII